MSTGPDRKKDWRELITVYLVVLVVLKLGVGFFDRVKNVWALRDLLPLLVALTFFLVPYLALRFRGESLESLGIHLHGLKSALRLTGLMALVTFPPFILLFWLWTELGFQGPVRTMTPMGWVFAAVLHLFYVALPEEMFYRGYLLGRLDRIYPRILTVFRVRVGFGLPLSAVLFALGHYLINFQVQRLGVFFPALIFGWMKEKSGGILAPALYHALCNILALGLEQWFY